MADVSFGEWLKFQRRAKGWTQKELALHLHCSISTLRKLEAEERRPSAQAIERLADIFTIAPTERKSFLKFARGDWKAGSHPDHGNAPWQSISMVTLPTANYIGHEEVAGLLRLARESQDAAEKITLLHQAYELAESLGDVHKQVETLWQLGWTDSANRFKYWEKALGLARPWIQIQDLADKLSTVGFFFILSEDLQTAQKYLDESSALYRQLNMKPAAVHLLSAQAQIALMHGDFDMAELYLQEHARIALSFGSKIDYLWSQVRLGYVGLRAGKLDEACRKFMETIGEFQEEQSIIGVVFTLEGMAGYFSAVGKYIQAARLIGWADANRKTIGDVRMQLEQTDVDKIVAACTASLGETTFSRAYEEGQQMTMDEAIVYAKRDS
jgi:transcriptional regulator with XRE-family HTH domain